MVQLEGACGLAGVSHAPSKVRSGMTTEAAIAYQLPNGSLVRSVARSTPFQLPPQYRPLELQKA